MGGDEAGGGQQRVRLGGEEVVPRAAQSLSIHGGVEPICGGHTSSQRDRVVQRLRSRSARSSASRSRIAARPSASALLRSTPKPLTASTTSDDSRSFVYRAAVSRTTRITRNEAPSPTAAPTSS